MVKRGFVAALLLSFCLPILSSAQPVFRYGAKAGVNFADIRTAASGPGFRTAPAGGLFVTADPTGSIALQSELLYMGKGFQNELLGRPETATLNLTYLEAPVLLKVQAPLIGSSLVNIYGGPSLAVKINESFEVPPAPGVSPPEDQIAKTWDWGTAIGIEFGFEAGEGYLLLDLRFTPGFSNISASPTDNDATLSSDASNQVFTFMAGYSL